MEAEFEDRDNLASERRLRKLLTEEELSELLRVSRDALAKFRRDREDPLPFMMAGRRYLYDEAQVLKWATRQARRNRPQKSRSRPR